MLRGLPGLDWVDASAVVAPAKLHQDTRRIRVHPRAQRVNELAMVDALAILRPGVRQIDLSAVFLRRIFELGASANGIDPIWQVMAPTRELGPRTLHGDLAYPTVTTDRFLREGDVIWVDAGITWEGYASDYGRTWITSVDPVPNERQQDAVPALASGGRRRARRSCKPGVSALDLCRAAIEANDGVRPGSNTSIWRHGWAPIAPKCPSSERISAKSSTNSSIMEPGWWSCSSQSSGTRERRATVPKTSFAVTDMGWVKLSGLDRTTRTGCPHEHPSAYGR